MSAFKWKRWRFSAVLFIDENNTPSSPNIPVEYLRQIIDDNGKLKWHGLIFAMTESFLMYFQSVQRCFHRGMAIQNHVDQSNGRSASRISLENSSGSNNPDTASNSALSTSTTINDEQQHLWDNRSTTEISGPETNANSDRELLVYPRNFFKHDSGAGPANAEQAKRLWMYRKNRRTDGLADLEEPDGEAMLQEIKEIRESPRSFIVERYTEDIRDRAKEMTIMMPKVASYPVHLVDFRRILNSLESTPSNQRMVFELVHKFHKDRHWLADAIDRWFAREGMVLAPQQKEKFVNGKRTRTCSTDRGGFSAVARSAKSAIVGSLMAPMLRNTGWSISLTKGQGKNHDYEQKVKYNTSTFFYVVVCKNKVRQNAKKSIEIDWTWQQKVSLIFVSM